MHTVSHDPFGTDLREETAVTSTDRISRGFSDLSTLPDVVRTEIPHVMFDDG